jgi:photosystem II stability/assembly factor-like uncharacterized protein
LLRTRAIRTITQSALSARCSRIPQGDGMTPIQGSQRHAALALALMLALPAWAQQPADSATATQAAPAAQAAETDTAATAESTDAAPAAPTAPAATAAAAPPTSVSSELMPLATSRALILDFAATDSRAIAVGERGQILLSESRSDWRQVPNVPTRANLNAVAAVGNQAWAVGHDGVIVHSADGGATWTLQRQDPWHPPSDDEPFDPRQGVPLLDILMLDASNGIAIGAYSLMLRTSDGGQSWTPVEVNVANAEPVEVEVEDAPVDEAATDAAAAEDDSWTFSDDDLQLEEESDPHLNAIARTGDGSLFIVAERGAAYRSRDNGATWQRLQLPYQGSMFGVLGYAGQHVLAFGMRGNAFESHDLGDTWTTLDTGTQLSLMAGAPLENGGAVLVGANGVVLQRPASDQPFRLMTFQTASQETPVLASVLPQTASAMVVGGERGVGQFQVRAQ